MRKKNVKTEYLPVKILYRYHELSSTKLSAEFHALIHHQIQVDLHQNYDDITKINQISLTHAKGGILILKCQTGRYLNDINNTQTKQKIKFKSSSGCNNKTTEISEKGSPCG